MVSLVPVPGLVGNISKSSISPDARHPFRKTSQHFRIWGAVAEFRLVPELSLHDDDIGLGIHICKASRSTKKDINGSSKNSVTKRVKDCYRLDTP